MQRIVSKPQTIGNFGTNTTNEHLQRALTFCQSDPSHCHHRKPFLLLKLAPLISVNKETNENWPEGRSAQDPPHARTQAQKKNSEFDLAISPKISTGRRRRRHVQKSFFWQKYWTYGHTEKVVLNYRSRVFLWYDFVVIFDSFQRPNTLKLWEYSTETDPRPMTHLRHQLSYGIGFVCVR